jgi:hypothetical protein
MDDVFPSGFDRTYFSTAPWSARVKDWVTEHADVRFSAGNEQVIRSLLKDGETGLRMVVNITAHALLSMLKEQRYRNLYENPVIGGGPKEASDERNPKTASDERIKVDSTLGIGPGTYFGAVALGGTGIRFYGEYCMVLKLRAVPPDTRLFDRDSYDILLSPLKELPLDPVQIESLRGTWEDDRVDMAVRRVLPDIGHDIRLVTSGTVSESVLRDQEFIEIHLEQAFGPDDLEEIRESPDETAIEMSLRARQSEGVPLTGTELEWLRRRTEVIERLDAEPIRHRVVTLHGRGYQWK